MYSLKNLIDLSATSFEFCRPESDSKDMGLMLLSSLMTLHKDLIGANTYSITFGLSELYYINKVLNRVGFC